MALLHKILIDQGRRHLSFIRLLRNSWNQIMRVQAS